MPSRVNSLICPGPVWPPSKLGTGWIQVTPAYVGAALVVYVEACLNVSTSREDMDNKVRKEKIRNSPKGLKSTIEIFAKEYRGNLDMNARHLKFEKWEILVCTEEPPRNTL